MRSLNTKINALEENIIPALRAKKRYIEDVLEQSEREEIFRLKMIKRAQESKSEKAIPIAPPA
jgi:V/A-type H+-transporting ATPase subunit D